MSGPRDISARSRGAAVRAFFAVPFPEPVRAALRELTAVLRTRPRGDAVRWVRPENVHLTLRFLGNVPTQEVPSLEEAARAALADAPAFAVKLGPPHPFPSPRRPRVVALDALPEEPLALLAERLEAAVTGLGLAPEPRRFRAHVTLGRLRGRRLPALDGPLPEAGELPVAEVVLYRSDPQPDGARYARLATLPLGLRAEDASPLPIERG